jgi:DNA polymerase-3 subunit alpha
MAQDIAVLEGLDTGNAPPLRLRLPSSMLNELRIQQLKRILRDHPGDSQVFVQLGLGKTLRLADDFCVDLDRAVGELRVAFGHDAVML